MAVFSGLQSTRQKTRSKKYQRGEKYLEIKRGGGGVGNLSETANSWVQEKLACALSPIGDASKRDQPKQDTTKNPVAPKGSLKKSRRSVSFTGAKSYRKSKEDRAGSIMCGGGEKAEVRNSARIPNAAKPGNDSQRCWHGGNKHEGCSGKSARSYYRKTNKEEPLPG